MGWQDQASPIDTDSTSDNPWGNQASPIAMPKDKLKTKDKSKPSSGGYLSESIDALKTGAKGLVEGASETISGMGRDYAEAAGQHPGALNMAGPIYGASAAIKGLLSSPAAELVEGAGMSGYLPVGTRGLGVAAETTIPERFAGRPPKIPAVSKVEPAPIVQPGASKAALPIQRETATPLPEPIAAPKWAAEASEVAKPEVKSSSLLKPGALDKMRAEEAARAPVEPVKPGGFSVENRGKSTAFEGSNNYRVTDDKGKHAVTIMAKQEGDDIIIAGTGGGSSGMTTKNMFGTSAMRKILPELQKHFPEATHVSGIRTTGTAAKAAGGVGDRAVRIKLPRPKSEPLRPGQTLADTRPEAPPAMVEAQAVAPSRTALPAGGVLPRVAPGQALVAQQRAGVAQQRGAPRPQPVGAAPTGYSELVTGGPGGAQAILQQRLGLGEREATKAITALEPYQRELNAAPRSERLKVIDYMENRSHGNTGIDPKFQAAADEMRHVYKDIEYRLGQTPSTENMKFIEDYFRHQVKDPKKATQFMSAWKEGSAKGATKKRAYPTVSDLLEGGHELVNDNPVEVTMDYAYHMNKFIAANEAFDIAKSQGTIKMMSPSRVPDGWLPISGRHGGLNAHGQAAYAPKDFAVPWNRFTSQGFQGLGGDILHGARAITNATTAVKLMSGYHFLTMGAASFTSELARSFDNLAYGRPITALRSVGSAATILGPVLRQLKTGLRGQRAYAGSAPKTRFGYTPRAASSEEHKIIDYLTQANFRPSKVDRSISVTQTGNLYTAWKRGALSHQLRSQMSDVGAAHGVMKAAPIAKGVWNLFGRTIDTIMAPLFEKTIPALKTGAAMESLRDFVIARPHASFEEIMTEARNVQRNMDDRFGEMNHDNLFWNQKLKEGLQASMLSYSWNVGIGRALGGGGKDIVTALGKKATMGKFGSAGWTRRASYALAFPVGAAYLSAVYGVLKGQGAPKGVQDLLAPRTGGVNPETKFRQETDERIAIPGHMKDIFELRDMLTGDKSPWDIAANKLNPMLRTAGDLISGHDWRGHRITDPEANVQTKMKQYLSFAAQNTIEPIFLSQYGQRKEGTNINLFETVLGIHPAPDFLQDPTGHGDMMRAMATKDYLKTLSALKNEAVRRGDTDRAEAFDADIHRRQQQLKRLQ